MRLGRLGDHSATTRVSPRRTQVRARRAGGARCWLRRGELLERLGAASGVEGV
jgi:hypothetical protein